MHTFTCTQARMTLSTSSASGHTISMCGGRRPPRRPSHSRHPVLGGERCAGTLAPICVGCMGEVMGMPSWMWWSCRDITSVNASLYARLVCANVCVRCRFIFAFVATMSSPHTSLRVYVIHTIHANVCVQDACPPRRRMSRSSERNTHTGDRRLPTTKTGLACECHMMHHALRQPNQKKRKEAFNRATSSLPLKTK